jgi:hypothetical protein
VVDRVATKPRVEFRKKYRVQSLIVVVEVSTALVGLDVGSRFYVACPEVDVARVE